MKVSLVSKFLIWNLLLWNFPTPLTICTKKTTTRKEEKEKMMQDRLQIKRMRWKDGRRKGKQIKEGDRIRQIGRQLDEN